MSKNVINFLDSKDNLYDDFRVSKKLIMLCLLLFFCALEIIFFIFDIKFMGKIVTILDLVFAIFFAVCGIVNFIIGCVSDRVQIHYVHYGVIFLLLSCYMFYIAIRIALFPLNEFFGFLGMGIWILISIICLLGIFSNIKHDYYNNCSKKIFWLKDEKSDMKYGIVITKYTIIGGLIVGAVAITLALLYFAFPAFTSSEKTFARVWQLGLVYCLLMLSYIAHFGWKLIIKQFFIHKYDIHVKIK